jgi:hypothetical protein
LIVIEPIRGSGWVADSSIDKVQKHISSRAADSRATDAARGIPDPRGARRDPWSCMTNVLHILFPDVSQPKKGLFFFFPYSILEDKENGS